MNTIAKWQSDDAGSFEVVSDDNLGKVANGSRLTRCRGRLTHLGDSPWFVIGLVLGG